MLSEDYIHILTDNIAQNKIILHKVTNPICTNKIKLLLESQCYHWAGEDTPFVNTTPPQYKTMTLPYNFWFYDPYSRYKAKPSHLWGKLGAVGTKQIPSCV